MEWWLYLFYGWVIWSWIATGVLVAICIPEPNWHRLLLAFLFWPVVMVIAFRKTSKTVKTIEDT